MTRPFYPLLASCILLIAGCAGNRTFVSDAQHQWAQTPLPPAPEQIYQVFLIGDAGAAKPSQPSLQFLKSQLDAASENSVVVYLGDNIYCCGLPDSTATSRTRAEEILTAQLDAVKDFKGRIVFIPGNHDWNDSRAGGLDALRRQEAFVETYLGRGNVFRPDDGFPGPDEIKLTKQIRLVILDTEWWLTEHEKSFGDAGDYDVEEAGDFLLQLEDLIRRRRKKDLLVVGHHPMFSNGRHDGRVPAQQHLFPLTALNKNLYLPLPVLGTASILFRQVFGGPQDLPHPKYASLRRSLTQLFREHDHLIYASGHDHNLQYFQHHEQHYIVSGSGSKPEYVAGGRKATFTSSASGHMTLHYYRDGSVWMQAWGANREDPLLFRTQLKPPTPTTEDEIPLTNASDLPTAENRAINPDYKAGALKSLILGHNNRDAWTMPVDLEVFDIGREAGGLTPIKRGGGAQTTSIRLEAQNGDQYVLRTLDKDPTKTVPPTLRTEAVFDIVRDQTTAIHPFGAFIIPKLADAIGIYHTHPKPVIVPDDPRFGVYQDLVANQIMLFEERPDDDMSAKPHFGRSKKVIGAPDLIRAMNNDNDHRVDQPFFLRNRLFDMLISDWDRHSDQWRWASFEPFELDPTLEGDARKQGKVYRPIPRDRDWAFNRTNGIGPSLSKILLPKLQDFDPNFGSVAGLTQNGFSQDRRMLNQLDRHTWLDAAEDLKTHLTDDVIEAAVKDWPQPIYDRYAEEIVRKFKIRREKLVDVAMQYYAIQAKVVDVIGSHKHERFEVTHQSDGKAEVVVFKTSKKGKVRKEIYRRTFLLDETEEIRLYGLDGNDTFILTGPARITVRGIGGAGEDTFTSDATGKKPNLYDTASGNTWDVTNARTVRSDDPITNEYHRKEHKLGRILPAPFFGANPDDGFFFGGGANITQHGFRKLPYARNHVAQANFAPKTGAFNIKYSGRYVKAAGTWDVRLNTEWLSPNNIRNFYGLGNETDNTEENRGFYQARLTQFTLAPALERRSEIGTRIRLGPTFEYTDVGANIDRFVAQAGIAESTFDTQMFTGLEAEVAFETLDDGANPKQGFAWRNVADVNVGISEDTDAYARVSSDLSVYLSPSLSPQLTFAARVGGAHNMGNFPFFSANTLGGKHNLRGYRGTRFAGRTSFYQNVEIRAHLFTFSTYATVGSLGVLGFLDNGRVWTDGEHSKVWHQGYGGGVWASLYNAAVLTGTFGFSEEDTTFTLAFGFLF